MNWENSRALTSLKKDFLIAFFSKNDMFYLTGGSALGIFYLDHRMSYDLDFFTEQSDVNWHILDNQILSVITEIGAERKTITSSPQFHRYQMIRGSESEVLDFVVELVPQVDDTKMLVGNIRVDTLREIIANKICTLIERSEDKDLVDLYFLHKRGYKVLDHFEDATKKEGALDPSMISFLLSRRKIDSKPDYLLEDLDLQDFRLFVKQLESDLAEMSFPE